MIINILGAFANVTSLILWIPQAKKTWENRQNLKALKGISIGTQIIVIVNTILWCIYGLMINNFWLPLGTIIILPLACFTIYLRYKVGKNKQENSEVYENRWFTFEMFQKMDTKSQERCLLAIYTKGFSKQVVRELLNCFSYEEMTMLEKMYWNKELWIEKRKEVTK